MENLTNSVASIHGFDPLETLSTGQDEILRDVAHRNVVNILKSYTGFYDLFAEAIQNALDAMEDKDSEEKAKNNTTYRPRIWISISLKDKIVRVTDNGIGMNAEQFKLCFTPNVSSKKDQNLRGQKGVGATFLAYGFSFVKLQTKQDGQLLSAVLRGGRQWTEDRTGQIPRPKLEGVPFDVPELVSEDSGTSIEIRLGDAAGERPKRLDWQGAGTAAQWLKVLRIKTPLGGVYLNTPPFQPSVSVVVTDVHGGLSAEAPLAEYFYPHDIPNIKSQDLEEVRKKLASIQGDPATQFKKLPEAYKHLNCLYAIWGPAEILAENSSLGIDLDEEARALVNRHSVIMYAAFVDSTKLWDEFNDDEVKLRPGYRVLKGGLQMASDFMVQGELITIPLTKAIGYQNNTHVLVHFTNGNPDLGRKTFQPEYHELGEKLAAQAVKALTRYRSLLRPDTGAGSMAPDKDLHEWKKEQETWREQHPINLGSLVPHLGILSEPREEQDVISLYHELVGSGLIKGIKFFAAKFNQRYDALIQVDYPDTIDIKFDRQNQPLGVGKIVEFPWQSDPKVLEYKFDLDALIEDFQKELKFVKHVNLVVCWKANGDYKSMFELKPLLVGSNGNERKYFGSTHAAFRVVGGVESDFEVVILDDLLKFLLDREAEEARQKAVYEH